MSKTWPTAEDSWACKTCLRSGKENDEGNDDEKEENIPTDALTEDVFGVNLWALNRISRLHCERTERAQPSISIPLHPCTYEVTPKDELYPRARTSPVSFTQNSERLF
jgi:hypothetical protein